MFVLRFCGSLGILNEQSNHVRYRRRRRLLWLVKKRKENSEWKRRWREQAEAKKKCGREKENSICPITNNQSLSFFSLAAPSGISTRHHHRHQSSLPPLLLTHSRRWDGRTVKDARRPFTLLNVGSSCSCSPSSCFVFFNRNIEREEEEGKRAAYYLL